MKVMLKGQIAEVVQEQGECQVRILIDPFYVTVKNKSHMHLGERVDITGTLDVDKMKQEFQPNGATEL